MKLSPEKLIALSASISLELIKGKSVDEINELKNLLNLISANLQHYIQQKFIFDTINSKKN